MELQYQPSAEQIALAGELAPALADLLPIKRVHACGGEDERIWEQLETLGILNAALDESEGGSGLGDTELALIALELGRNLASPAILATVGAVRTAAALSDKQGRPLRLTMGFSGDSLIWVEQPGADYVLILDGTDLHVQPIPRDASLADAWTWGTRLLLGSAEAPVQLVHSSDKQRIRLVFAAALSGIAIRALDMAVEYAKTREQFGRAIGSFQAVKHHCATMAIAAKCAQNATTFAAVAIDGRREDARYRVEAAFLTAAQAAVQNAGTNIQVHGGIGFSAEADPHLLLKRAQLLAALLGGVESAAERVAEVSGASTRE